MQANTGNPIVRKITKYNIQHPKIRQIMSKYWHLLTIDPILGQFLNRSTDVTIKRASSL